MDAELEEFRQMLAALSQQMASYSGTYPSSREFIQAIVNVKQAGFWLEEHIAARTRQKAALTELAQLHQEMGAYD